MNYLSARQAMVIQKIFVKFVQAFNCSGMPLSPILKGDRKLVQINECQSGSYLHQLVLS